MKFREEVIPNHRIAYMRRVGPYGPANSEVMERLKKWAKEKGLFQSAAILAISQDDPKTTKPVHCRFDACIVLPDNYQLDDSIDEGELSGGKYLIFEVEHTDKAIQEAYTKIFPILFSNGYQLENKPIIERYIAEVTDNPFSEICVPIKP